MSRGGLPWRGGRRGDGGVAPRRLAHPLSGRQGTVIVERWWKVPLAGEGRKPRLHRRHRVYRLVEDTKHRPKDNLELFLTQSVEGKAGARGLYLRPGLFGVSSFLPFPTWFDEEKGVDSAVIATLASEEDRAQEAGGLGAADPGTLGLDTLHFVWRVSSF